MAKVDLDFFSSDFSKLTPELQQAIRELKDLQDEAKKTGNIIDKEFKDAGDSVDDFERKTDGAMDNFNQQSGKSPGILGQIGGAAKSLVPAILAAFSVKAVLGFIKGVVSLQKELAKTRREVAQLTGLTGKSLSQVTASVKATADAFDKDFQEVLIASNTVAREFGITQEQAIQKIQQGFSLGADVSGEFLDVLKEYPAQFQAAGLSADEAIQIINQSVQEGIFSDKGPDLIKEATLRLREMTPATRDALNGIGLSADAVQRALEDGTKSVFDIIQEVSAQLDTLPENSARVGTAIADIFGGPGEDAGLRYIKLLKDVDSNLDEVISTSDEYTQNQLNIVEANEKLELAFNRLFGSSGSFYDQAIAGAKVLLADGINALIDGTVDLINYFIELYNESVAFRGIVEALAIPFKNTIDVVSTLFNQLITGFSTTGKLIKAVFTGDFKAIGGIVTEFINETKKNVFEGAQDIAQNYVDGFNNVINPKKIDLITFDEGTEQAAEREMIKTGGRVGKSFANGFGAEVKKQIVEELKSIQELIADEQNRLKAIVDVVFPDAGIDEKSINDQAKNIAERLNKQIKRLQVDEQDQAGGSFLQNILGINPASLEDTKNAANAFLDEFGSFLDEASQLRIEQAEARTQELDDQIAQTQEALDQELALQREGKANNVDLEKQKLEELKQARADAENERQKAVRQQLVLDSIAQASSIATAAANILKGFSTLPLVGQILGIAAVASMIGGFIAAKARAKSAASFFKGGEAIIDGLGNVFGNDKSGYTGDGSIYDEGNALGRKPYTYHKREFIFNNEKTAKHLGFFRALNSGNLSSLGYDDPTLKMISSQTGLNFKRPSQVIVINNKNEQDNLKMLRRIDQRLEEYFSYQFDKPDLYFREVDKKHKVTEIRRGRKRTYNE